MDFVRSVRLKCEDLVSEISHLFPQLFPSHHPVKNKNTTTSCAPVSFNTIMLQSSHPIMSLISITGAERKAEGSIHCPPPALLILITSCMRAFFFSPEKPENWKVYGAPFNHVIPNKNNS